MNRYILFLILFILLLPKVTNSQPDKFFESFRPRLDSTDLKIIQLEMKPDPVREGQSISFQVMISNQSSHSAKLSLFIKDKDRVISSIHDIRIYPGYNQIIFPESNYRFSRDEHCFIIEVDIERTIRPIDAAKKFCARRSYYGWTLQPQLVGPIFVEDLEMFPDPAIPGQEIKFKALIRNEGYPIRTNILILDKDQVVTKIIDVFLPSGFAEVYFPYTRYFFQRNDHCFTVFVDFERFPYKVNSKREFCARPLGWTLRP